MKDSVWLVENSWNDATHCDKVLLPDFGGNTHTHKPSVTDEHLIQGLDIHFT